MKRKDRIQDLLDNIDRHTIEIKVLQQGCPHRDVKVLEEKYDQWSGKTVAQVQCAECFKQWEVKK